MAEREVKIVITGEDRSKKALKAGEKNWKKFGKNISGFIGGATKALAKLGAAAAIGIGAISVTSIKTAIEVESAFAGVIKTTEGLVDEFGILNKVGEDLRGEFRGLARDIPTDLPELMQVGELGGQLGIAKENLVSFTKTVAALGEATNLTREQAATAFAQISNIMGTSQEDFDRMGSSVVELGNNFATTESDIVNFAQRIAATGKIAGLTEADVFGIAAAFSSVGIQAEAGGTAVQKVLTEMTRAVADGGKSLDNFAKVSGISADEFKRAFEEDAAGAFTSFVEGLGEQGDEAFKTLAGLELMDQRLIRAFLSLAGAGDLLSETIASSNEAWGENTALAKEAEARYRTFASQLDIAKNIIKDVALSIGDALLPFLRDMLVAVGPVIKEFAEKLPELLETKVIPAIQGVIGVIKEIVDAIREGDFGEVARILGGHLRTMYSKALDWVGENIGPLVDAAAAFLKVWVADWVTWLTANIGPFAKDLGEKIRDWIAAATTWVKDNWGPITEKIGETLTAWAAVAAEWFKDNVVPKVAALGEKIRDWLAGAVTWVKDNWGDIIEKAGATLQAWADAAVEWFKTNVVPAVAALGEKVRDWIEGAIDWAEGQVAMLGANLGAVLEDVSVSAIEWFEGTVEPAAIELGETFSQIVTDAIAQAEAQMPAASVTFGETIRGMIRGSGEFLIENLPDMAANLGTIIGKIVQGAIGLFAGSGTFTQMRDEMFLKIWEGIITGSAEDEALITSGFNALVDAVTSMWEAFIVAVTGDPDFKATLVSWWEGLLDDALDFVVENLVPWSDLGWEIVAGVLKGIDDAWEGFKKDVVKRFTDLVNSVKSSLGISSPSTVFAALGIDMMKGLAEGIDEEAAQVIKKLSKAIGRIVNAFAQLTELQQTFQLSGGQLPDIGPFLDQFELTIRTLFWRIEGLIEEFGEKRIKKVRKSAKRLREIVDAVMIDMSGIALADLPDMAKWRDQIIDLTRAVMQALGHLAFEFGEQGLEAAAVWAESVKVILSVVKPAVDALAALLAFEQTPANIADLADKFAEQLLSLVELLAPIAGEYRGTLEPEMLVWFDAVKKIISVVEPGIKAIRALIEWPFVQANLADITDKFAEQLLSVVELLAPIANEYRGTLEPEMLEWFDAVKKILGVIKPGIEAIKALVEWPFVQANLADITDKFAEQLLSVVELLAPISLEYRGELTEAMLAWFEAVKKVISIIEPGIKAIKALIEWPFVQANLADITDKFAEQLLSVVELLAPIAGEYRGELTEAMTDWFEAVKKVISIVEPGIKAIKSLIEWPFVQANMADVTDKFAEQLLSVVDLLAPIADEYRGELTEEMTAWFEAVKKIISVIGPGIEALKALLEWDIALGAPVAAEAFARALFDVSEALATVADEYDVEFTDEALKFFDAVKKAISIIAPGVKALEKLGEFVAVKELLVQMDIFKGQMKLVIDKIIELAGDYETEGLDAVIKFAVAIDAIFKGMKVALEALKKMLKLPETGEVGLAKAAEFFEDIMTEMVMRLGLIAVDMETTGLAQARKFSDAAVQIRTAILAGINSILVLGEAGLPGLGNIPVAVGSMVDQIIAAIRMRLTSFFDVGFAMGRSLAQGIILGMQSGLTNMASGLVPFFAAANGFSGVVTRPTIFLAGERGPESVNITPGGGAQSGINIEQLIVQGSGNAGADVANTIRMLEFGTVSP